LRVSFIIVVSDLLTVEVVSGMVAVGAEGSDFISAVALVVETTVKELLLASVMGLGGEATVGVAGWLTLVDAGAAFYSAYVVVLLASVVLETVAAAAVVLLVGVATAGG
jgi:hypothetical protein